MISITPFGGCGLHNPLAQVFKRAGEPGIFGQMGFRNTPFSLSANTNHQLIDYVTGEIDLPDWIRSLAYADGDTQPTKKQGQLIYSGDVALVEMSTPTEFVFQGTLLNINRFEETILNDMAELSSERKIISRWKGALRRGNEEVRRQMAEELYYLIPNNTEERRNIAEFVRGTSSRILTIDEMEKALADLRDRLKIPMALVLHNFNYLPNGEPVSWPADFKDNSAEIGRRLGIPTLDTSSFVAERGVKEVMESDLRHFKASSFLPIGELLYNFCANVIEKPGLPTSFAPAPPKKAASAPAPVAAEKPPKPAAVAEPKKAVDGPTSVAAEETPSAAPAAGSLPSAPQYYQFDPVSGGHLPDNERTLFAVVVLGGAWAMGTNSDPEDKALSNSSSHAAGALMFNAGVRAAGKDVKTFIKLQEQGGSFAKETPCAGIADQVIRNSWSRFRRRPEMLFFAVGRRATSLSGAGQTGEDGLLRGSVQHREVTRLVARARDIAAGQKLRLEVAAICLLHGEYEAGRNVSGSAYRRGLSMLQLQYDADIRAMTGQSEPVRLYLTQTNRGVARFEPPEIPIAQLNAGRDNPYVQCVGPTYFAAPEARTEGAAAYVKAAGYRRIGQLFGRFLLDDLWGGQREPLRVEEAYWTGPKTVRLRYNRPVSLEEDDARVNISALGPGLGVDFNDGAPWSPTVESVRATRGREAELDVELTAPPTGPRKRVLIATRTTGAGGVGCLEGARSAIRSKEPFDTDPIDDAELFDWACSEQINLP